MILIQELQQLRMALACCGCGEGGYLPFSVAMHAQVNSQWLGWGIGAHQLSFSAMDRMSAHSTTLSFSVATMMGLLLLANILNSHFSSMVASGNACSEPVILSGYECSPLIFSENEWRQSPFLVAIIGVKAPPPCSLAMIFQPPFLLSSRRHNEFKLQGARKACWCWVGVGGVHFLFSEKWEVSRALPRSLVEDTKQGCCFLVRFPSCTKGHNE